MLYGQDGEISGPPKLFTAHDPIKVINVSDRDCWIEPTTPVARIAEYGNIPIVGQFVRPGLRRRIHCPQMRQEAYEQMLRDAAPPAVMVPKYKWPTKLLVRPREPERAQVTKIVEELPPQRDVEDVGLAEDVTLEAYTPSVIDSLMAVDAPPELVTLDVDIQDGGRIVGSRSCGRVPDETAYGSECNVVQDDLNTEDEDSELPSSAMPGTPLARLDAAYTRCMRVSAEELDLEPAVYIREWGELMSQLKDQLVMLPDLDDLSPECDIEAADVGEHGESTEAQEEQLKSILKRHKNIFLGDGNAAPPPARGVICDLDVGDAKPVAQRPRWVGPHLVIKVYELLKKLLEATLIEHSESPWASPIVIMINNCLWGLVRLLPEAEAHVDQDVLDYLELAPQSPSDQMGVERSMTPLVEQMTVFRRNIPAPSQMGPVLGRSSYIDDIAHGAATWDQLCGDLDALLYRLRYWSISVSLPKSEKRVIPYLSHEIGAEGIRATPKIIKGIQELPFPSTLKGVQSFLGILNYYPKFIEDCAVVAASLYELTDDQVVSTPLLRHPDRTKPFVIIPHANQWAACAVLGQMHDGLVQPVRFTGRVLSDAELKYHIAEKEVLAVMRVLHVFKNMIEGCPLIIYIRHSVLKWVINSKTAEGRLVPWGVALSQYDLEIRKVSRDEDGLAAGITPREHLDEVAEVLIPAKGRVKPPPVRRLAECETLKKRFQTVRLVHMKREFNQAADYLTSKTL
ncbi:reverse transcriptase, partial [Phytophthora megakarya]